MTHYIGDPVVLTGTFTDPETGEAADPAGGVTFIVRRELDATEDVTGESDTVGTWTGIYTVTGAGLHQVRCEPPDVKVQQDSFWVEPSNVA